MRRALGLVLLAAGLALAGDEGKKLELLPKPEKGMKERLVYKTSVDHTNKKDEKTHQAIATDIVRKIKTVGDDGLSETESLAFEKTSVEYDDESGNRQTQDSGGMVLTYPIERSSKSRRALVEDGAPEIPDGIAPQLMAVFRRDPDGLARVLTPEEAVKEGDTWQPSLKKLLLVLGPKKAKLVAEGSKAEAKLESSEQKGEHQVVEVTLEATLLYTTPDDAENPCRLNVSATLHGPGDGSGPPTHEEHVEKTKRPDGSHETLKVSVDRKKVEAEAKEDK